MSLVDSSACCDNWFDVILSISWVEVERPNFDMNMNVHKIGLNQIIYQVGCAKKVSPVTVEAAFYSAKDLFKLKFILDVLVRMWATSSLESIDRFICIWWKTALDVFIEINFPLVVMLSTGNLRMCGLGVWLNDDKIFFLTDSLKFWCKIMPNSVILGEMPNQISWLISKCQHWEFNHLEDLIIVRQKNLFKTYGCEITFMR